MNNLLIYNQNIASQLALDFKAKLGKIYNFQIGKQELLNPYFSIDEKISDILENEIKNKKYDVIFIPYSLSEENYIEFIGLRFAFHIRLTPAFKNIQTPIVFYGYDSIEEVNKLTDLGSILFSKNIFTTSKISVEDFEKQVDYIKGKYEEINENEFEKRFLNRNTITPSGNYATHHSITNEWSIYRWAKALKIENEQIRKIEKSIGSNLYFKYLKVKYPISDFSEIGSKCIATEGKILYVDDELEKGWDDIFKKICFPRMVKSFGSEFKNWDTQTIIDKTIERVNEFDPAVVILDFRLHDDDFEVVKPEDVTGYKILKKIKAFNQGIQVIILSATNKIWNLVDLQKAGADGFIMKESPELSVDEDFSKNTISNIYEDINDRLKRAKELKKIYTKIKQIKTLVKNSNEFDETFRTAVFMNLEIGYKLFNESYIIDKKYSNYSYLQFFLIIEEYLKQSNVFEEGDNCYVIQEKKRFLVRQKKGELKFLNAIKFSGGHYTVGQEEKQEKGIFVNTNFKMSAVLIFKFDCTTSGEQNWTSIYTARNQKAAHPVKDDLITFYEIDILMDFMLFLFDKTNYKDVDISKALSEPSFEESLEQLKNKFNKK